MDIVAHAGNLPWLCPRMHGLGRRHRWRTTAECLQHHRPSRPIPAAALYSSDGGVTWRSGTLPKSSGADHVISNLSCADQSHCAAILSGIGRRPLTSALETTDGGKEWSASPGASPSANLQALSCSTRLDCWASAFPWNGQQGGIYVSIDGGRHWTRERLPTDRGSTLRVILDISCSTRFRCVALANRSTSLSGPKVVISYGVRIG